jgi:hypothetical protein
MAKKKPINNTGMLRGWEAIAKKLQKKGVEGSEFEAAQDSFDKGIEVLSKLYLYIRPAPKNK